MLVALLDPFLDPASRTNLVALATAVGVALVLTWARGMALTTLLAPFRTASTALDVQLMVSRQLLRLLGWFPSLAGSTALAVGLVGFLDTFAIPDTGHIDGLSVRITYTVVLFLAWDASRFVTHWLMHRVPMLWAFHQVHHSAESLTPLTFHRTHPVESLIYQVRGILVTGVLAGVFFWLFRSDATILTILGVHSLGWVFNTVSGNLRHSEVWWSFGWLETVLISPAQHQVHHGRNTDHVNLGTWFALWDHVAGTHSLALQPPEAYGLDAPNHGHDLVSAWVGPFRSLLGR